MAGYNYNPYPYNYVPNMYPQLSANSYAPVPTPAPAVQPQPQPPQGNIVWVDGEVGAKAYQLNGQAGPVALWDTNDTVIYVKSVNQMGMPNPLQKIRYQMEEPAGLLNGMSNTSGNDTQSEIESLHNEFKELKEMLMQQKPYANQNGSKNVQNGGRGGNQNA